MLTVDNVLFFLSLFKLFVAINIIAQEVRMIYLRTQKYKLYMSNGYQVPQPHIEIQQKCFYGHHRIYDLCYNVQLISYMR